MQNQLYQTTSDKNQTNSKIWSFAGYNELGYAAVVQIGSV